MSLTTPTTITEQVAERVTEKVTGLERSPICTIAQLAGGRTATLPAVTDTAAASRWRAAVVAVHGVDIEIDDAVVRCSVRFTPRRSVRSQRVPLRIGLGLTALGTPTSLHELRRKA